MHTEKHHLYKKELQEFDRQSYKMRQVIEGQLYKYTNVIKGWQYRWFVLDAETGMLEYYMMDETEKTPRGGVQLAGAVISPSDEDSQTFTVNTAQEEVYRLRASDAKERQYWVNKLREVSEYQVKIIAEQYPPLHLSSANHIGHLESDVIGKLKGEQVVKEKELIHESFSSVCEMLLETEKRQQILALSIDEITHGESIMKPLNMELLMLKATSSAALLCLDQCFSILQRMKVDSNSDNNRHRQDNLVMSERKPSGNIISETTSSLSLSKSGLSGTKTSPQADFQDTDVAGEISDAESDIEAKENEVTYDKATVLQLLSKLKLGMDLTKVNFPTFLLEPFSLLEMYANFMQHPDYFVRIADETTPETRIIAVVQWYLTSIHVGRKGSSAKKPYNPILGETFRCSWKIPEKQNNDISHTSVTFVAEQVSHFPPTSAFYIECQKKKIYAEAHISVKSKFLGTSIGINLLGEGSIHVLAHKEIYKFNLPSAFARSVPSVPWVELGGRVILTCKQSGCSSIITFHTNPFYGDKLHRISAEIKNAQGETICKVNGQWNGKINFIYANGQTNCTNVQSIEKCRKRLRPLRHQDSTESRKVWHKVTEALKKGNIIEASHHKHQVETKQREDEGKRNQSEISYPGKLFHQRNDGWTYKYPLTDH